MPPCKPGEKRALGTKHRKVDVLKLAQRELNRQRAVRKAASRAPAGAELSGPAAARESMQSPPIATQSPTSQHRIQTLRAPVPFILNRK